MANDIYNRLELVGNQIEIQRLRHKGQSKNIFGKVSVFTFNAFIPMPSEVYRGELRGEFEKLYPGTSNRYGWCKEHWGVKGDCYNISIHSNQIQFYTAWSPPYPVLKAISRQFPKLKIYHYAEDPDLEIEQTLTLKAGRRAWF